MTDAEDLWLQFVTGGLCGLCGNWGIIPAHSVRSPAGTLVLVEHSYCICPNGRTLKSAGATPAPETED
jgi:hypothetical protein